MAGTNKEMDPLTGKWWESEEPVVYGDSGEISAGFIVARVNDSLYLVKGADDTQLRQVLVELSEMADWSFYNSLEASLREKTMESRRKQEEEEASAERVSTLY
jgi:hypothetical protein